MATAVPQSTNIADGFATAVTDGLVGVLRHQRQDGSIIFRPDAPDVYPQQAIFPMAFAWAGLDPQRRWHRSSDVLIAAGRLGTFLLSRFDDQGRYFYNSYGYKVYNVDQRLTYAWLEALRIFREAGADLPYEMWADKLLRAAQTLAEQKLKRLTVVRRFTVRLLDTSTNHVALYLTTVYRAGQVLNCPELCEVALPIARAMAEDMHPDGYWDEHSNLSRTGGPTPSYNYLTMCAMGLMAAWTNEPVFEQAVSAAARFHMNFCYPDATCFDLIDERVRYEPDLHERHGHYDMPRIWGLFAMSGSPQGRVWARRHMERWQRNTLDREDVSPQALARHCENFLYWKNGPLAEPPAERFDHQAKLTLGAGIYRHGPWCIGLSCLRSTNQEDEAYRDNPFALDRQKLFSIWHERTGLLIDGSNSKYQPANSTFAVTSDLQKVDHLPCGGTVRAADGAYVASAIYRTFYGAVWISPISATQLRIEFDADLAGCTGPIVAAFTIPLRKGGTLIDGDGHEHPLSSEPFTLPGDFTYDGIAFRSLDAMALTWPLKPFNSYAVDHVATSESWLLRVSFELTRQRSRAQLTIDLTDVSR